MPRTVKRAQPVRRIVFVTPTLSENSLGRTYALWLLAEHLGWDSTIVSPVGGEIWRPVQGTEFARRCALLAGRSRAEQERALAAHIHDADAVIAVKPYDESFGLARTVTRAQGVPLLLDVDDPDYETRFTWARRRGVLKRALLRDARAVSLQRVRKHVRGVPTIVSNPVLQGLYGGSIVPHARVLPPTVPAHTRSAPVVAFIGTPRAHKGVDALRAAVAQLADDGFSLVITGDAPADAHPWEEWVGSLTFEDAMSTLTNADIVALPSPHGSWSRGQLPAKLMDAMALGRGIIVSDVGPLSWAVGDGGRVVAPDSVPALVEALSDLADPQVRQDLADAARERARAVFSVEAVAATFESAVCAAVEATDG